MSSGWARRRGVALFFRRTDNYFDLIDSVLRCSRRGASMTLESQKLLPERAARKSKSQEGRYHEQ